MAETKPGIILVNDLRQALDVAVELGAGALALDVEGVLEPFYGNDVDSMPSFGGLNPNTESVAMARASGALRLPLGLMTNNTNHCLPGQHGGLVDLVAARLGGDDGPIPYVHKGMKIPGDSVMGKKPDGTQGTELARMLGVDPSDMVLIDDQGVKNFGEASIAGMRAIIVPSPIGFIDIKGRVVEHPGVMRFRRFEPGVYADLASRRRFGGFVARMAYRSIAGVPSSGIGFFEDRRAA